MFISADEAFVFKLADKGLTLDRGKLYGFGRIVLCVPKGSPLRPDAALEDLAAGLKDGRVQRFAIANPEHAPHGRAAQEALTSKGLWEAITPKPILGENVSQATQFAISGSSQGGIIALSLALPPTVSASGTHVLIPEDLHTPPAQRMVLLKSAGETAKAFYAFIQTDAAKAVLRRYGFRLPGEKDWAVDWQAFQLSIRLGVLTVLVLLPIGVIIGRWLAYSSFRGKGFIEAVLALPLVLPPTVAGYYLLMGFGATSPLGEAYQSVFGNSLVFSFEGLLLASVIVNLPFAIQPMQRAFEAIPPEVREAAAVSGLTPWQVLLRIDLPLAWPGIVTGLMLSFAHTLGEFGVVLMVGGSIPGETKTMAIAIYDRVQAFDNQAAGIMSLTLLITSFAALGLTHTLSSKIWRRRG